jgi:hypothetical protein
MVVGGAVVAFVVAVIGAITHWWDSTDFLLLILAGSLAAGATAWYASMSAASPKPSPLPLSSIEFIGAAVVAVLGIWRTIELVFDLDQIDDVGGIVDLVAAVILAAAGVVMLIGTMRRDPTLRADASAADRGVRLAVGGLALVLLGWALNLSIGPWRMSAGSLSIALSTIAVIVIVVAPRWEKTLPGIPVAWLGAVLAVIVAFLAIGHWGSLGRLGEQTELGLTHYVPFLIYVAGVVLIIVGGVLAGQTVWAKRPKPEPAPESAPTAPEPPAAAADTDEVSSTEFVASVPSYAASEPATPSEPPDPAFWDAPAEPPATPDDDARA